MSWCYTSGPQSGFYTPPPGVFCIKRIENFCNNSPEQVNLKTFLCKLHKNRYLWMVVPFRAKFRFLDFCKTEQFCLESMNAAFFNFSIDIFNLYDGVFRKLKKSLRNTVLYYCLCVHSIHGSVRFSIILKLHHTI